MGKTPAFALCTALGLLACQPGTDAVDEDYPAEAMTPATEGDLVPPLASERESGVADTQVDVSHLAVSTAAAPGRHIVDSAGHPVYLLEGDRDGSGCTGACLETWPPLLRSRAPGVQDGLEEEKVATLQRADGAVQVSYNGHPLYYYARDPETGGTPTGHDVHDEWGGWYLLTPEGEPLHGDDDQPG